MPTPQKFMQCNAPRTQPEIKVNILDLPESVKTSGCILVLPAIIH